MRDQDTIRRFDLLTLSVDDYWIVVKNGVFIAILAYIVAGFLAATTSTESWFYVSMPPVRRRAVLAGDDLGGLPPTHADPARTADETTRPDQEAAADAGSL